MSSNNAEGLWALVLGRYASALHIVEHVEESSLVRRAAMEVSFLEGMATDHFGLAEAFATIKEHVKDRGDFPP